MTMTRSHKRWPQGTGQWSRARNLIFASPSERSRLTATLGDNAIVVTTPLEVITTLETEGVFITTVVLAGASIANQELAMFLRDEYPRLEIVDGERNQLPYETELFASA